MMTMKKMVCLFFLMTLVSGGPEDEDQRARAGKVFSLFSIVQFPNDACDSTSPSYPKGTCLASTECTEKGGTVSGKCAAGFGVCCVFSVSTCGSTVSNNITYISNPGFPSAFTTVGACNFVVKKCADDICQLRLDFSALALNVATGPATITTAFGCCGSACTAPTAGTATPADSLTVAGQTGVNPPVICAINTGLHMYVEIGSGATDTASINFALASTGDRTWNVKVTQIACDATYRAPNGCTQYFTGTTGTISSYGFGSGQLLQSQQYDNCVRKEAGYCSIVLKESSIASPDPFGLTNADAAGEGESTSDACIASLVFLKNGYFVSGTEANAFCGEALAVDDDTNPTPLTSTSLPFALGVLTTATDMELATAGTQASGFRLDYTQGSC